MSCLKTTLRYICEQSTGRHDRCLGGLTGLVAVVGVPFLFQLSNRKMRVLSARILTGSCTLYTVRVAWSACVRPCMHASHPVLAQCVRVKEPAPRSMHARGAHLSSKLNTSSSGSSRSSGSSSSSSRRRRSSRSRRRSSNSRNGSSSRSSSSSGSRSSSSSSSSSVCYPVRIIFEC